LFNSFARVTAVGLAEPVGELTDAALSRDSAPAVLNRAAEWHVLKCLATCDEAATEAVAIVRLVPSAAWP
jgi:hypothetical protein